MKSGKKGNGQNAVKIIYETLVLYSSETKTILVQRHMMSEANRGCSMPFSWRIKDFLDELWVYARQREGNRIGVSSASLVRRFCLKK